MNSINIGSPHRLDTWCSGGVDYSYHGVAHHEIRSQILQAACKSPKFDSECQVDRLDVLAGSAILVKITVRDDLTRVANKIGDSELPSPIKRRLMEVAGCNVRQAKAEVSSSFGLAMEVARARVINGARCGKVAIEHGITCDPTRAPEDPRKTFRLNRAQTWIQKYAVQGEAGRRVERGESCSVVAREHEILFPEALEKLELRAIRSVGRKMMDQGKAFEDIVDAIGIELEQSKMTLQDILDMRVRNEAMPPEGPPQ